jgi:hypothetical protein
MRKKWLAVGIIVLFLGVTLAPTINFNTVKASQEDNIIEITSQPCGIKGYSNTTVKLTQEQYQNLEEYLVRFSARLNQTSTREETILIFKEAVVELNTYGLLPKGMDIKQAQNLVTLNACRGSRIKPFDENLLTHMNSLKNNETVDFLCMIVGESTNTYFQTVLNTAAMLLSGLLLILPSFIIFGVFIWSVIHSMDNILLYVLALIAAAMDAGLGYLVFPFLITHSGVSAAGIIRYAASQGWIHLTGHSNVSVNGTFNGNVPTIPNSFFQFMGSPGVIGFTGLHLKTNHASHKSYYFGTALMVVVTT